MTKGKTETKMKAADPAPPQSMQESTITLPVLVDGVVGLGDLWDCKTCTSPGNLFGQVFEKEDLEAFPIQSLEYTLFHTKNTHERMNALNVSASVSIDIPQYKMKFAGSAKFEREDTKKFNQEELMCTYRASTFVVRVRQSAARLIDPLIRARVKDGAATHYVQSVRLGGAATANIRYSKNISSENLTIGGSFEGTFVAGPVNVSAKLSLEMLDKEMSEQYSTEVSVDSRPRFDKAPTDCEQMFKAIDSLDAKLNSEQHFPIIGSHIVGVPLSFKLAPLSLIMDDYIIDPTFKMMEEGVLNEFQSMIFTCEDFQLPDYIKGLIVEREPRLVTILKDGANPYTVNISKMELEYDKKAKVIRAEAFPIYSEYKKGKKFIEDIQELLKHYEEYFDCMTAYSKIEGLVQEGKQQLNGVHATDAVELGGAIKFFSNETDLVEWWNAERNIKVKLQTQFGGVGPSGTFLRLFNLSGPLAKYNVEIGIAFPNVSEEFSLTFKIHDKVVVYKEEDMPFALKVLGIAIDNGELMTMLFYRLASVSTGLNLNSVPNNLPDITSLVSIFKENQDIILCETYPQLVAELLSTTNVWNFVLPLQAINASLESMTFFRQLKELLPIKYPRVVHRWIVGRFNVNIPDAPLLLVFRDEHLEAICLDHLDILILLHQFSLSARNPDLSILSHTTLKKHCFYTRRANFALKVLEGLVLDHTADINAELPPNELFPELDVKDLTKAQILTRACAMRVETDIINTVANYAIEDLPDLAHKLSKYGWTDDGFLVVDESTDWKAVHKALKTFLGDQAPYLIKVEGAIESILELKPPEEDEDGNLPEDTRRALLREILKFITDFHEVPTNRKHPSGAIYIVRGEPIDETIKFENLKKEIDGFIPCSDINIVIRGVLNALERFYNEEINASKLYFHLIQLTRLVESLSSSEKSVKPIMFDVVKKYCERKDLVDAVDCDALLEVYKAIDERNLFKTIRLLSNLTQHPSLYWLTGELYNLKSLTSAEPIKEILENMPKPNEEDEDESARCEYIWSNPKFVFLIRIAAQNKVILETIYLEFCEKHGSVPRYIPKDIEEKLLPYFYDFDDVKFDWPQEWKTVEDLIHLFQILVTRKEIPSLFPAIFRQTIETNFTIKQTLTSTGALHYWNEERRYFEHPWGIDTIANALGRLMSLTVTPAIEMYTGKQQMQLSLSDGAVLTYPVIDIWRRFTMGGFLSKISDSSLSTLLELPSSPLVGYEELHKTMDQILPYLTAHAKMHNSSPIQPAYVKQYIKYPPPEDAVRPGHIDFELKSPKIADQEKFLMSKGDLLTGILNAADPLVIHHLYCSMMKAHLALPLMVPGILAESDTYKFLLPAIQPLVVKELELIVPQPHLMTKPFRFVLCIRIGDTKGKLGKSTILNQLLMSNSNFYSCFAEPGADHGKPVSRSGLVEFTWMSRSTVSQQFYDAVIEQHYDSVEPDMLLLGNLHGDALTFDPLLQFLKTFTSSFVVFWKATNWNDLKARKAELTRIIGAGSNVLDLVIHPDQTIIDHVGDHNIISIGGSPDDTKASKIKLQDALREAFSSKPKTLGIGGMTIDVDQELAYGDNAGVLDFMKQCRSAKYQPIKGESVQFNIAELEEDTAITCTESIALIDFLRLVTIQKVKEALLTSDEPILSALSQYMMDILSLPILKRNRALAHVTYELDHMSRQSSSLATGRVVKLRSELQTNVTNLDLESLIELQDEVKSVTRRLELTTLSIHDIFRFLLRSESLLEVMPGKYAEMISSGLPVEIFQPTYGDVMWAPSFRQSLRLLPPDTRVFVISMIGIKAAGKSTILNRLFGQSFSEGPAGCTKGLHMRLLWVDEGLRKRLNADAFLVIDSEGFGAPENFVDEQADLTERNVASFLLGISHLVIANVMGNDMKELKDILEIGFAAQARILNVPLIPDMILLHQEIFEITPFRGDSKNSLPYRQQWGEFMDNVKTLARENEAALGVRVKPIYRMENVQQRYRHDELIHEVQRLSEDEEINSLEYHKNIQSLHIRIVAICQYSSQILRLDDWYQATEPYWKSITELNIPNKFHNCVSAQAAFDIMTRESKVKRAIDLAFRFHDPIIDQKFKAAVEEYFDPNHRSPVTPNGYDGEGDLALKAVHSSLNKIINTCESGEIEGTPCNLCLSAFTLRETLFEDVKEIKRGFETVDAITNYMNQVKGSLWAKYKQRIVAVKIETGKSEKMKEIHQEFMKEGPAVAWVKFSQYVSTLQAVQPVGHYIETEMSKEFAVARHLLARLPDDHPLPDLESIVAFDLGNYNKATESSVNAPKRETLSWDKHDWLVAKIEDIPSTLLSDSDTDHYLLGMGRELRQKMGDVLLEFAAVCGEVIHPTFKWEAQLYAIKIMKKFMGVKQAEWDKKFNPIQQLISRRDEFEDLFE